MSCLLGFDTKPYHHVKGEDNNALMLNSNYLPQLAIMLLVSLQQINYSAILAASRRSKSFSSTTSNYVPSELRSVFVRGSQMVAFVLPMMILFMALVFSLTPPLNVVGVFYLLIYFFVLYMRYPSPRTRAMKHLLRLFCVLLCCVFMARYVIQFNAFIPKIGSKIFTKEFVDGFDLYTAGLQKYHHSKLLFVYLLALSLLALALLFEVKIISSKLRDDGMQALWEKDGDEEGKEEDEDTKSSSVRRLTTTALLAGT